MVIRLPKDLIQCERYFRNPDNPRQRQYEAIRTYYCDKLPSDEVARMFGYSPGSFRQLCHQFRNTENPEFFVVPKHGHKPSRRKIRLESLFRYAQAKLFGV